VAVKEAVQLVVRLTGREAQVLRLIARGCTYVQAAAALGISGHTVGTPHQERVPQARGSFGGGGGDARGGATHFLR
jgi:FixJ family two-component response regulator